MQTQRVDRHLLQPPPIARPATQAGSPWAASYRALLTPVDALAPRLPVMTWHFCRDARGARRLAGPVEDLWQLQADGRLQFERRLRGEHPGRLTMEAWVEDLAPPAWLLPGAEPCTRGLIDLQWHEDLPQPRRVTYLQRPGTVSLTLIHAEAGRLAQPVMPPHRHRCTAG